MVPEISDSGLAVVRFGDANWVADIQRLHLSGKNFFIILGESDAPAKLAEVLELPVKKLPKPITRSKLFLQCPFVASNGFDAMLSALEQGQRVYFLKQLDLPTTQPPRYKRYLVYGDMLGIISHHDFVEDARESWADYQHSISTRRQAPEACIYRWDGQGWASMER